MSEKKSDNLLTPAQQKFCDLWEQHTRFEFENKNVADTLSTMVNEAHLMNIPTMKGGVGLPAIGEFYSRSFIPHIPPDTETVVVSRTVGNTQLVEELIFKFTHTITMDWMLPGIKPTGKRVEVALVVIVGFSGNKICSEHIYWDQASVLTQIGLLDATKLPVSGVESAEKLAAMVK